MMSYSRRLRYSRSPSPYRRYSRSVSRSLSGSRSRSRSRDSIDVDNPGNNLYVTGLSPRITKKEIEKHFSSEGGTVVDIHLVVDPWTRESRGFGFVTMSTVKEADRCLKYLNHSVLEGRVISVEKRARRRRGRTPTPGRYLGLKNIRVRRRSPSYSPYRRSRYSPRYSSERDRDRSYSPYSRRRSISRSRSPYSRSPVGRRDRSYSSNDFRHHSPRDRPLSHRRRHFRSVSRSVSPRARRSLRRGYSHSVSPRPRRNYSHSLSPRPVKSSRTRVLPSVSPRPRRSSRSRVSASVSPRPRSSRRRVSRSASPRRGKSYSWMRHSRSRSYSRSRSVSLHSRSSRSSSPAPRSASPLA